MEYSQIMHQVTEILADKLNLDISKIHPESQLIGDLGMDSFGSIEVMFELEEKFGIKILENDISKAKIVKDIADYIVAHQSAGQ